MVQSLPKTRTAPARSLLTLWVCVACGVVGAVGVRGALADPDKKYASHEWFPSEGVNYALEQPRDAESAASGVNLGNLQLPAPALSSANNGEEITIDASGPKTADGQDVVTPNGSFSQGLGELGLDDDTRKEGMLQYSMVFNPSVVPFKRSGVLDLVKYRNGQYKLGVRSPDLKPLAVAGSAPPPLPGFDRFWGSVHLQVKRGEPVSIPSVSPDAMILEYRSEPMTSVQFFSDGAGNQFIAADHTGALRLNFLTEAPSAYFGAHIVPGDRLQDIPPNLRPPKLPKPVSKVAARVVAEMGITSDMDLGEQVAQMVAFYRGFSAQALDPSARTDDEYRDITLSRRGVCRHRAFSFVVTAQHLGIPARYVFNEAHAFVEVYAPSVGWMRVDLGGSAEGLEISNTDQKLRHEPAVPDPFPGAAPPGGAPRTNPSAPSSAPSSAPVGGGFDRVTNLPQSASELQSLARSGPGTSPGEAGGPPMSSPLRRPSADVARALQSSQAPPGDPSPPPPSDPSRATTHVMVLDAPARALRGEPLTVHGQLFAEDGQHTGIEGQTVSVVLLGQGGAHESILLYEGPTGPDGMFEAAFEIPPTLPLGAWELLVVFPGSDQYRSARSD